MKKILTTFAAAVCVLSGCSDDDTQHEIIAPDEIALSAEALFAGPEGADDLTVTVVSSSDWRLAGHCDWAQPSAVAGRNGDTVTFAVEANDTGAPREANFKFFAGEAVIPFRVVSEPEYTLTLVSEAEQTFGTSSNTLQVLFDTNLPKEAFSHEIVFEGLDADEEPWLVYEDTRAGYGKTTLEFSVAENAGYRARRATVRVAGMEREFQIDVMQKMVELLEVEAEKAYKFDLAERTFDITIRTSIDYEVVLDEKCADWIGHETTVVSDEKGLRTERLTFRLAEARASRSGRIAIEKPGAWRNETVAEFTVSQKDPNAVNVEIPDANFAKWLLAEGWIAEEGEGIYIATEKGLTATELVFNPSRRRDAAESVEGIASFPELVKIDLSDNALTDVDFSGLTKLQEIVLSDNGLESLDLSSLTTVTSLVCYDNSALAHIDLGCNPIRQFAVFTDDASDGSIWEFEEMTIRGELLEELNIAILDRSNTRYDQLETLDLSGCPALKKLDCRRGSKFTKLILKSGITIPDLQKNEGTEIEYR